MHCHVAGHWVAAYLVQQGSQSHSQCTLSKSGCWKFSGKHQIWVAEVGPVRAWSPVTASDVQAPLLETISGDLSHHGDVWQSTATSQGRSRTEGAPLLMTSVMSCRSTYQLAGSENTSTASMGSASDPYVVAGTADCEPNTLQPSQKETESSSVALDNPWDAQTERVVSRFVPANGTADGCAAAS